MGLQVAIVGAGIAGLAASISLARAGHNVAVYEKSGFKSEVGAAITITPNGTKILDSWGFDFKRAGAVKSSGMHLVNGATMKPLSDSKFDHFKEKYSYTLDHYHRVDLHNGLREIAEALGVRIELGCLVEEIDARGTVQIRGRDDVTADLIVLADGSRSKHLHSVTGKDEPLHGSGRSVARALIPQDKIRSNPRLAPFFGQEIPGFYVPATIPPTDVGMICYPCRDNTILNVAIAHNTLPGYENRDDWHSPIEIEDVLKIIPNFHPACAELLAQTDGHKIYSVAVREPLSKYVNDRLVVTGDAAHVMPPTHAQGAVTSIEEACALGVFLGGVQDREEVPSRLKLYEELVKPRMQTTQLLSQSISGKNSIHRQKAKEIWEDSGRGTLYPDGASFLAPPITEFFFSYDMRAEADRAMQKAGQHVNGVH